MAFKTLQIAVIYTEVYICYAHVLCIDDYT